MKRVYHSSIIQNLKILNPVKSTHGVEYVYGTKDLVMSAVFLSGFGGDFTCCVGRDKDTGKPYICERFQGAFDLRYNLKFGSIYVLPGDTFIKGKTHWSEEVVSTVAVEPIEEIKINDAKKYLEELEVQGMLLIVKYPDKIDEIPNDDEDLVERAVVWSKMRGDIILEQIKKFHPNLLSRVIEGINNNNKYN
ncbi:hypothetical protein [Haloimpatiens massiliensis]|uniref:hypothetical protein n=1 Tax=Haloimpatiens massiliensis TaxID=1658110 RepID=UPI000C848E6D|nr:hypothetical protein [Haloimpatiens massiliensis]